VKVRPRSLLALALSLASHCALYALLGPHPGAPGGDDRRAAPGRSLTVHLVSSSRRPSPIAVTLGAGARRTPLANEAMPTVPVRVQVSPRYYKLSELTQKPFVLRDVAYTLPHELPPVPVQSVIVRVLINEFGQIDRVSVEQSHLPKEVEDYLVESFSKTSFYPGKIGRQPVKSLVRIEVNLDPSPAPAERP
jgi:hypothetical protein